MKGNSYSSPLEREHHVGVVQRCNSLSQTDIDLWNKPNLITEHPIGFPSTSSYSLNMMKKPSIIMKGICNEINLVYVFCVQKKKIICQCTGEVIRRSWLSSSEGKVLWQTNQQKH